MSDSNPKIPIGDIAFYDNYIPSLEDGEYTISAKTEINGTIDTQGYFEKPITQDFEVRGPQFTLPATEVHSVYPPRNSNSIYDQYLPNIVFNKRVLPWERYFNATDKSIPWLCLLVFEENEIVVDPKTNSSSTSSTVQEFLAPNDDVLKPSIPLNAIPSGILLSNCASIQIPATTFNALSPKVDELKYLSHVRQVNTGDQAIMDFEDVGWFSVIAGNRLLKTSSPKGTRFYVHLVSVEGYFDIMSGKSPWPKKKSKPTEDKDIALASLYSWSFLSQPEKLNFKEIVENFQAQSKGNPNNLLLRRNIVIPDNPDPTTQQAIARFQEGYIPLNDDTAGGATTFSWFRGPLSPVIAQPLPRPSADYHFPSAESAMIYDKSSGVFDQSYAAAWSLGRALALADGTFSQALLKYRKKTYSIIGKLMDALESADEASAADLSKILKSNVMRDTFKDLISKDLGGDLDKVLKSTPVVETKESESTGTSKESATGPVDKMKAFFATPAIQDLLKEEVKDDLVPIATWLANRQLLYDVPFNHLVPDQLELPVESLRFFYVDQNWLDCLVDGAISINIHSSKDSFLNAAMRGVINDAITVETKVIREKLLGSATGDQELDSEKEALSGILIRSSVVSGWPGLVVKGFKGDYATGTQLKMLRMDKLSSNVLLCVFLDIPDTVMLAEPQQGLCFGVEDGEIINLRQLSDPPGKATGKNFPATGGFSSFYRQKTSDLGRNVLKINDGKGSILKTLETSEYLNTTIQPSQFALQMVKAPEEISFTKSPS